MLSTSITFLSILSAALASNFYWYGQGNSTCWQTGQPGSPAETCSNVGPGFLSTPGGHTGGLEHMSEGGIGTDLTLSPSGDYCSYYRLGGQLTSQDSTNEGALTGFSTPTPYSSYQEGDKTASASNSCQADGTYWGQAVRGPSGKGCTETCGIHHFVSLRSQGTSDRPWAGTFVEPSLVLSAEAGIRTFNHTGSHYGGWGYVCPELEDTSFHGVIEYCFQEWRSTNNSPEWKNERKGECGGGPWAMVNTYFWPGTVYATEMGGSTNTFEVGAAGEGHFEAKITRGNLINAIKLINSECAGWHLSENPENYALVGVEQGLEGWSGVSSIGGYGANLQLRSEYTQRTPTVNTGEATGIQETSATLNGTLNPNWSNAHYYFQYGKSTSYGSNVPVPPGNDAGAGNSSVPASSTATGLEPGQVYHFRLVASNAAGTAYGVDRTFRAHGATQLVFYNGNGNLNYSTWNGKEWSFNVLNHALTGDPVAASNLAGELWTFYSNSGALNESVWNGHEWGFVSLGHAIIGDPAIAANPHSSEISVYYDGGGGLDESFWTGTEGGFVSLGHGITGNPAVVLNPRTGEQFVYYNDDGNLNESFWNGHEWGYEVLNHAITGNPSVVLEPSTGKQYVYYSGNGNLNESFWNGHEWGFEVLNHAITGNPVAGIDTAGEQWVFYNDAGALNESIWNGHEWGFVSVGHALTGDPALAINPETGENWVYYDGDGDLDESFWNGHTGGFVVLGHALVGSPTVAVNTFNE